MGVRRRDVREGEGGNSNEKKGEEREGRVG